MDRLFLISYRVSNFSLAELPQIIHTGIRNWLPPVRIPQRKGRSRFSCCKLILTRFGEGESVSMDILAISEDARVAPHLEAIGAIRLTRTSWRLCFAGRLETLTNNIAQTIPSGAQLLLIEVVGCLNISGGNHK